MKKYNMPYIKKHLKLHKKKNVEVMYTITPGNKPLSTSSGTHGNMPLSTSSGTSEGDSGTTSFEISEGDLSTTSSGIHPYQDHSYMFDNEFWSYYFNHLTREQQDKLPYIDSHVGASNAFSDNFNKQLGLFRMLTREQRAITIANAYFKYIR